MYTTSLRFLSYNHLIPFKDFVHTWKQHYTHSSFCRLLTMAAIDFFNLICLPFWPWKTPQRAARAWSCKFRRHETAMIPVQTKWPIVLYCTDNVCQKWPVLWSMYLICRWLSHCLGGKLYHISKAGSQCFKNIFPGMKHFKCCVTLSVGKFA